MYFPFNKHQESYDIICEKQTLKIQNFTSKNYVCNKKDFMKSAMFA